MEALDGNAIAGTLFEHFGTEMTTTIGACAHCGNVVMVLVPIRGELRVDSSAFRMEQESDDS